MKSNLFIFFGPPGCGKGSLSNLCVKRLNLQQLSTGNLCRQHIANSTQIGKIIDFTIKSGKLISDEIIIEMVEDWLNSNLNLKKGIILDGFPRTIIQADKLNKLLAKPEFENININLVKIEVSDKSIINRLERRAICQNNICQAVYSLHEDSVHKPIKETVCDDCGDVLVRRSDDTGNAIVERLKLYHKHEQDLFDFYKDQKIRINIINGEQPLEEVYKEFVNNLNIN